MSTINERFGDATSGAPPTQEQRSDVGFLRRDIVELAERIEERVPEGRNKSLALTALEDVQMRVNRAIFMDAKELPNPREGGQS